MSLPGVIPIGYQSTSRWYPGQILLVVWRPLFELISTSERQCIDTYLECMSALCEVHEIDKARLFAYLAVGSIPDMSEIDNEIPRRSRAGLRLGEAAEKGIWSWESPILGRIKALLEAL